MGSHSPTMRLSSLPLFLCLLVSASGTFRDKEKIVKEGGKKEEGGGCFEVYHTEEQLQYKDVCEQSFREVCGTEYSEECHDEPTTRLEEQCDTSVVNEPVKVGTSGLSHNTSGVLQGRVLYQLHTPVRESRATWPTLARKTGKTWQEATPPGGPSHFRPAAADHGGSTGASPTSVLQGSSQELQPVPSVNTKRGLPH